MCLQHLLDKLQTLKFAPQTRPSRLTLKKRVQKEGLPLTTNPQIGRQTLNKFDYPFSLTFQILFLP